MPADDPPRQGQFLAFILARPLSVDTPDRFQAAHAAARAAVVRSEATDTHPSASRKIYATGSRILQIILGVEFVCADRLEPSVPAGLDRPGDCDGNQEKWSPSAVICSARQNF